MSVDSLDGAEAEDEEDERSPEPSRAKFDFFAPFRGMKPSKDVGSDEGEDEDESRDEEEEEEGENSWIVEDEGRDGVPELPVAFNMSSHQDLSHHFKIICQLFVHLAVRSPSQRVSFMRDIKTGKQMNCLPGSPHMTHSGGLDGSAEDGYFYAALSTARRKIMGMRDSLITSSTWQTNFKRVLEKYPILSMFKMDFAVLGCDACNLGGRMSKQVCRLSGEGYDRSTFEVRSGFLQGHERFQVS